MLDEPKVARQQGRCSFIHSSARRRQRGHRPQLPDFLPKTKYAKHSLLSAKQRPRASSDLITATHFPRDPRLPRIPGFIHGNLVKSWISRSNGCLSDARADVRRFVLRLAHPVSENRPDLHGFLIHKNQTFLPEKAS